VHSGVEARAEQVEGRQAVRELLRARRRAVHEVIVSEGVADSEVIAEILELASEAGAGVRVVSRAALDAAAETDAPQGVIARAEPLRIRDLDDLLVAGPSGSPAMIVVLDGITDPHNLGAVMRSALCAGATGMVLGRHRSAGLGPAAVKAAAGAVEHLRVATVPGVPTALTQLSDAGIWTVGLDPSGSVPLWDLEVATQPVALVLGAEGRGLSRLSLGRCEVAVAIPMSGPLQSLNVSSAAALACFEVARRRAAGTARPRP
jgi:23S rRNA (guanosine2251-2'-O)-methyltransferase